LASGILKKKYFLLDTLATICLIPPHNMSLCLLFFQFSWLHVCRRAQIFYMQSMHHFSIKHHFSMSNGTCLSSQDHYHLHKWNDVNDRTNFLGNIFTNIFTIRIGFVNTESLGKKMKLCFGHTSSRFQVLDSIQWLHTKAIFTHFLYIYFTLLIFTNLDIK
jgi:hypothetical protein